MSNNNLLAPRRGQFANIDTWLFDLDETLYARSTGLQQQIGRNMGLYVCTRLGISPEEATAINQECYSTGGTSLSGLLARYPGVFSPEHFLDACYAFVDFAPLAGPQNAKLRTALQLLGGRRIIFTNGTVAHAQRTLAYMGIGDLFDQIIGIDSVGYASKPDPRAFNAMLRLTGINPATTAMFEDSLKNLKAAKAMGMRTIYISEDGTAPTAPFAPFVDAQAANVTAFVHALKVRKNC